MPRRLCRPACLAASVVACSLAAALPTRAEEPAAPTTGFWSSVLERLDVKTKPATMPDFVRATRPDSEHLTFIPTGPVPRNQPVPVKSADEVEAAKAALDAAQAAQAHPGVGKAAKPVKPAAANTR